MKRRDDDLLRLAFGELDEKAKQAVEARADALDRAEIDAFRRLHEGLRHMPTPPPDGLSAERLRAAILDRELKARPKPFAWGPALFAPLALAALAAVIVLPRMKPRAEPQIFAMDSPVDRSAAAFKVAPLPEFPESRARGAEKQARSRPQVAAAKASEARARVASRPARRRHRRHTPRVEPLADMGGMVALTGPPANDGETPRAVVVATETIAAPLSAVVEADGGSRSTGAKDTVVVVSGKRDLETGAPAATEKEAASVLVGG